MVIKTPLSEEEQAKRQSEELESLLTLAEEFQEKLERVRATASTYSIIGMVSLVVGMLCFFLLFFAYLDKNHNLGQLLSWASGIIGAFTIGLYAYRQLERTATVRKREGRALREVIGILRESEGAISQSQNWTTLQRAKYRIRLSRFGVGGRENGSEDGGVDVVFKMVDED